MATYYVNSGAGAIEYSNRTWSLNELMVVASTDTSTNYDYCRKWIWECTTAGTSNATPTWVSSVTDDVTTITQNGVVWTARKPDNKTHALPGLLWLGVNANSKLVAAGDTVYISHTHSKLYGATHIAIAINGSPTNLIKIISTNFSDDSQTAGAVEATSNGYWYDINGNYLCYGITFNGGNGGASEVGLFHGAYVADQPSDVFINCLFYLNNTGSSSIAFGGNNNWWGRTTKIIDCQYRFGATNQYFVLGAGVEIYNLKPHASSSAPATAFYSIRLDANYRKLLVGCEINATTGFTATSAASRATLINCKIGVISSITYDGWESPETDKFEAFGCGTDGEPYHYHKLDKYSYTVDNTGVYLTTGGYTAKSKTGTAIPMSLMMTSNTNVSLSMPCFTPWFNVEISSTGSKTISIKIAHTLASVLKDTEVYLELQSMENSGNVLLERSVTHPVISGTDFIDFTASGSNLTDTAEAWTGITSEKTHTLSKTITINQIGFLRARVCLTKVSTTIYINPIIILS